MHYSFTEKKRIRKSFAKRANVHNVPFLLATQLESYENFLQADAGALRTQERRSAIGFHLHLPDRVAQWFRAPRVPVLRAGRPRVRRQGMPAARPDLRVAAARQGASGDPGQGIADQAGREGNEGAGSVHGRIAAHDHQRFVRHQRHRARDRLAAAPFAGRVLRARPRQDALVGQAAVLGTYHSLPRFVARLRVRPEGHPVLPRRPPPQDAGDDPAEGHRHDAGADPRELLRVRQLQPALGRRAKWNSWPSACAAKSRVSTSSTEDGKTLVAEGQAHQRQARARRSKPPASSTSRCRKTT